MNADWTYDRRRSACEILPWLSIGPLSAARDKEAIQNSGITMLLAIQHKGPFGSRLSMGPMRVADELGLSKAIVEVTSIGSGMTQAYPKAFRIINQHLHDMHYQHGMGSSGNPRLPKVLVFCESGNEASASVAAAYLIRLFEPLDHIQAMQIVSTRRFSANYDDDLKHSLLSYSGIIKAKRDVARFQDPSHAGTDGFIWANSSKRGLDRGNEEDMDVDDEEDDDLLRFGSRSSFAPFQDAAV
ncbi:hypothetical protein K402DRAFT_321127 [Aulographum hederae CBS 113979]|uniref:Protein-tyrosine-phosphatase n=1 Tax=Aulographum hederae CBS 113979 TaxID=1176131 RepID=A0A6G1HHD2_9PEZI|nr:hypothetical protein K402DRAFT_321127 [Aulographum hederae CBS 113979]